MQGYTISVFTEQDHRIGHRLVAEWLLDVAKELDIGGVTSFAGINGIGRHGHLHSTRFFELADRPITVVFAVSAEEADALIAKLDAADTRLFYIKAPVEFGSLGRGGL